MDSDIHAGQLWVNAKVRELAQGREPAIQAFEWEDPGVLTSDTCIGLAIWIGAERRVIRFLGSELAEAKGEAEVHTILMERLTGALQ